MKKVISYNVISHNVISHRTVSDKVTRSFSLFPLFPLCCILLLLLCATGCDRRDITYFQEAEIEINVDWSGAGLDDTEANHGATALFYPVDGSSPKVVLMGNRCHGTVRLPAGRYNVIVFNRSFNDFSAIAFRGTEHHHTLEAYACKTVTRGEEIVLSPEKLAAAGVEGFEVTEDMLGNYGTLPPASSGTRSETCALSLKPRKLVEEMSVTVHVTGLHNIRSATATMDGVAASVYLFSGLPSEHTVTHRFELGCPTYYPGSDTDGTMSAAINGFTFNTDIPHRVDIEAQLVDGKTTFEQSFEAVNIAEKDDGQGSTRLVIEVNTDPVPDVKPDGSTDSGFDADVDDWGGENKEDILL